MLAQTELRVDWVSHYLYESPWLIIAGLAIVWTAMRIIGRRTDKPALRHASWVPLGLIAVLGLTAALVTTPREKLNDALDAMLLSVEDKDFGSFRALVAEDAEALFPPGPGAERFTRDMVEQRLKDADIRDLVLLGAESAMMNERDAVTVIRLRAQGDYAGFGGVQIYQWAIQWRYEDDRWRAQHFECLKIGFGTGSDAADN